MKKLLYGALLMAFVVTAQVWGQEAANYDALLAAGKAQQADGKFAEARAEYEKALAIAGLTAEQTGQALVGIGQALISEKKVPDGIAALKKALALKGISNETRITADLLFGNTYLAYPWVLDQARDAFLEVLGLPDVPPEQQTVARQGLVKAYMGLRKFGDARTVMLELMGAGTLTPAQSLEAQKSIAMTYMLEGKYTEARDELAKLQAMEGLSNSDKALIQLNIGLSYYESGDLERAKPELEKVLTMPDANTPQFREDGMGSYVSAPLRAAKLRLLKIAPAEGEDKTLAVLFVGSSMTYRGFMPLTVERMAASAPADRPRIMIGMHVRMGTKFDVFWNNGDTRDTVRGELTSMPWDVMVMETFYTSKLDELLKYGQLFADYARSKNIRPVFYESHPAQAFGYPEDALKYHADNVELSKKANAALAPVLLAEMHYLEAVPTAKREEFYDDWVHPSQKGIYMISCCIYSAVTGYSPVGLYHPENITNEDAKAMQEAAWKAVQEANPDLKPME